MNETIKKAVTYSLLAHIKNSGTLSDGPLDIFIPLVKKGLHYMNTDKSQYKGESINEIKTIINNNYAIDIPLPTLKIILKKIAQEINAEEKIFELYKDDGFWIKGYIFEDFDQEIEKSKKEIENLQDMFQRFCGIYEVKEDTACIIKFIEKNKMSISSYLVNTTKTNGHDYTTAAQFVEFFKQSPSIYSQIKNLYLGSILTCFLEYKPSNAKMEVTLLLDTNFLVSLLDLNTPESTNTCQKLLEVSKTLGYNFFVLSDTIEETKGLLNYKASSFDKAIIAKYITKEDIYNACERRNLNAVDLNRIADNLESFLASFNIGIIHDTSKLKKSARFSNEYELLKKFRNSDKSALHDAIALLYVKEKRKKPIREFENVNCWFVNNSISHDADKEIIEVLQTSDSNKPQPEVIKADDLLNILWLSNPSINTELANSDLVEMGLTSLIAFTLNDSLPKSRIIKELDENIQKYKSEDFTDRDVLLLSTRVATRQIKDVDSLNELAKKDSSKFAKQIKEEAKKQKKLEETRVANIDHLIKEYSDKLGKIKEYEQRLAGKVAQEKNESSNIDSLDNKIRNHLEQESLQESIEYKQRLLTSKQELLNQIKDKQEFINRLVKTKYRNFCIKTSLITIAILGTIITFSIIFGMEIINKVLSMIVQWGVPLASIAIAIIWGVKIDLSKVGRVRKQKYRKQAQTKFKFNPKELPHIEGEIRNLEKEIQEDRSKSQKETK